MKRFTKAHKREVLALVYKQSRGWQEHIEIILHTYPADSGIFSRHNWRRTLGLSYFFSRIDHSPPIVV